MLQQDLSGYFPGQIKHIPKLTVQYKHAINKALISQVTVAIQDFLASVSVIGTRKMVVGLSGGVDSAICGALLKAADVNTSAIILELDDENFLSPETMYAITLAQRIGLDYQVINAARLYTKHLHLVSYNSSLARIHMRSRVINNIIFQIADNQQAAVIDTTDKSEEILKIYEESFRGHLAPLSSLYKSELYDLADYFNLSDIKEKNSGCLELTDIDAFSVPWNELDPILYLLVEKNMSPECIAKDFSIDLNWLRALNKRIFIQPLRTSTKKITLL